MQNNQPTTEEKRKQKEEEQDKSQNMEEVVDEEGEDVADRGADEPAIVCAGCSKDILSGKYQIVPSGNGKKHFHTACLVCDTCGLSLVCSKEERREEGGERSEEEQEERVNDETNFALFFLLPLQVGKLFAEKGGKLICEADVKKGSAECKRCKEPILGRRIVVDDQKYPSPLLPLPLPLPLPSPPPSPPPPSPLPSLSPPSLILLDDPRYHEDCFVCDSCEMRFGTTNIYYQISDQYLCFNCKSKLLES